jgi:hypothetical protein
MPDPWTHAMPPDTRAVGTGDPANDEDANVDALTAMGAGQNVLNPVFAGGADPFGVADSSAAFNAARTAGMVIFVPAGTYKLGSTVGPFTTGQFVMCDPGVTFSWTGTGDCFRFADTSSYNARTLSGGGILGFPVIDGTSDGAGSAGIHAGDILNLRIDAYVINFSKAGDILVLFDNQNYWTEQMRCRLWLANGTQHLVFNVSGATTSTSSFGWAGLDVHILAHANQDGVVLQNGALLYISSSVHIRGNFQGSGSAQSSAVLRITGAVPAGHPGAGQFSRIVSCMLNVMAEANLAQGANAPQTIAFGTPGSNLITGCMGVLDFSTGTLAFVPSNWSATANAGGFNFFGFVGGDASLNPAAGGIGTGRSLLASSALSYGKSFINGANGATQVVNGDFFSGTLSASITINLNPGSAACLASPQRKTIVLKQNAGGGFTVTWPHAGSPTVSAPTVLWAGGTAPTMTATANAVDVYFLETVDGATWYGRASQNVS